MSERVEVVICLGSSCFARGNKSLLKTITQYIKDNNLQERINFHGGHCFGYCAEGPILRVDGVMHTNVDDMRALEILNNTFEI
ncbi:MAG: (2Fe-2S) ferredoxin domain-containing protein [Tenuifilaceae bacterium]|jgi:NADH:ubiquinone oxidoreductase subunit E|nr:(2Fe-2S) ferredoxin domain-containing protein [Tenuifilaceae bacterium]